MIRILRASTAIRIAALACALAPLLIARELDAQTALKVPAGLPDWTFNIPDKEQPSAVKIEGIIKAPGSAKEYEAAQIGGNARAPDWFPEEHPAAPRAVTGGAGITFACGTCHLMSGQSHPEAADIAGMPAAYLIRQMSYYKAGTRKDDARMGPIAKATSDEDIRQAAEYFAALKPAPWVKVIETATPPKTFIATAGRHRELHPDGGMEPIGQPHPGDSREPFRTEIRDPHSGFIAYVPPGSIARGEALVKNGRLRAPSWRGAEGHGRNAAFGRIAAALCGAAAFRFPLWLERRQGRAADEALAAKMSEDEIIAIASYLGSLPPQ